MRVRRIEQLQELGPWITDHSSSEFPKRLVYVYYCEICNSVLALRSTPDYLQSFLYTTADECPTCHFRLELSLRCRALSIRIPANLLTDSSTQPNTPSDHTTTSAFHHLHPLLNSNATQISELTSFTQPESPMLSFGDNYFDEACGGLHVRQLAVLYGEKACQTIAEQLCVRVQLPIESGGLNARSVFIDGGNTFDVYHVSDYAATLHLDRDKVLRGINVSRAFTCYQLVNLIVEKLPKLLRDQRIGVVVVSNLLDLFTDLEVDLNETKHTINFLSGFLAKCVRENRIALVITCAAHEDSEGDLFRQFLTSRAQIVLRAERRGYKVVFDLEKHPIKERISRIITLPVHSVR
jgi:hypothetical protein